MPRIHVFKNQIIDESMKMHHGIRMPKYFLFPCHTLTDDEFARDHVRDRAMNICGKVSIPYTTKYIFNEINEHIGRLTADLRNAEDIENICTEFKRRTGRELRWSEWYI